MRYERKYGIKIVESYIYVTDEKFIILRGLNGGFARLEEYFDDNRSVVLKDFGCDSLSNEEEFSKTIAECKRIIGKSKLYVEKQFWMMTKKEINEFYG